VRGPRTMRGAEAETRITADSLAPVYFLYGENAWARNLALTRLKQVCVPDEWKSVDSAMIWADETPEGEAVMTASTAPFGGLRRLTVVRRVEVYRGEGRGRAKKPVRSPLVEYVADPSDSGILVLVSDLWEAKKWEGDALFAAAGKSGCMVECMEPSAQGMEAWIAAEARSSGITMSPAAVGELLDRTGEDTLRLKLELDKLTAYLAGRKAAGVEDVLAVTGDLAPPSVFEFLDVLFVERNAARAFPLLSRLMNEMHPLLLHSHLVGQVRKLIALKDALKKGGPSYGIAKQIRIPVRLVERLGMMVRRTPTAAFARLLESLAWSEGVLKRGGNPRWVMEELVLKCCRPQEAEDFSLREM